LAWKRSWKLLSIDLWDSLRPLGFDIMLILVGAVSGVFSVLQPITTPANAANSVLGIIIFITALYLALRASSDLVNLTQAGVMRVYMTYPISRRNVSLILYFSRVFIPSIILLGIPAIVTGVMLYPVVGRNLLNYVAVWLAYILQVQLYGSIFVLTSTQTKSSGTAAVMSIVGYFAYVATSLILSLIGSIDNIKLLTQISTSMEFYNSVYYKITGAVISNWELVVSPIVFVVLFLSYVIYFARRFES